MSDDPQKQRSQPSWPRGNHALGAGRAVLMLVCLLTCGCHGIGVFSSTEHAPTAFVHEQAVSANMHHAEHPKDAPQETLIEPGSDQALPEQAGENTDARLSLDQARRIAVRDNPDVHAAQARLEAAASRIDTAQSRFYPTVSFRHSSTRTLHTSSNQPRLSSALQAAGQLQGNSELSALNGLSPLLRPLVQPFFSIDLTGGSSNSFSDHATGFSASWILFDGYIRSAQLRAARFGRGAAAMGLADVRRLIIQSVDRAYYQVQLAQEQIRIARADESFSQEQYEETKKLQAAGRATQADTDNFRVRVLTAQASLVAARGLRDTGITVLGELMGKRGLMRGEKVILTPLTEETAASMTLPEVKAWRMQALRNRPDLLQLRKMVAMDAEQIKAARGRYSPTVQFNSTWGFERSSTVRYTMDDQSGGVGIEVRWDLYTGGDRRAQLRRAKANAAQSRARLQRAELAIESSVKQAIIDLADAQEQIRLQRESLTTALENRRVVQVGYVAGAETLNRLNETQRDYIAADANLARARIRLRQAWSDLYAAAGQYDDDLLDPESK